MPSRGEISSQQLYAFTLAYEAPNCDPETIGGRPDNSILQDVLLAAELVFFGSCLSDRGGSFFLVQVLSLAIIACSIKLRSV